MPRRTSRTFTLTDELVAAYAGGPIVCLPVASVGQSYRLHAERPGPELNRRLGGFDSTDEIGGALVSAPVEPETAVIVVSVRGVIEQRAGYHDICGGWTDGHDAIAERLCAAFAEGDVLLIPDSPGGACAGIQEAIRTALKAKAQHSRRVTTWVGEMCGSAMAWWAFALSDEIFVPEAGIIGSIGARSSHCSIAGALAKDGVEMTHFYAPDEGKIAFAQDRPLSDEAKYRGNRDVWDAHLAFESAVCSSAVGQRYGLTPESIRKLKADALSGKRAVAAGLADGVASLDDVETYALALASGEETSMPTKAGTEYEKTTKERYTEEDPAPTKDPEEGAEEEEEPENEEPAEESEDDDPEKDAEDDAPPSSKPIPPKDGAAARAPKAMKATSSIAEILGASGDSLPALKTAAIQLRQLRDHAARITGQRSIGEIIGGLSALSEDAAKVGGLEASLAKEKRRANYRDRMALLHKLAGANLPGYARGDLFVDVVEDVLDDKGKRTGVKRAAVKPAPLYARASLSELRGFVNGKLKGRNPPRRSTPFEPDRKAAEQAAGGVDLKVLEQHPAVKASANRPGAPPIAALAAAHAASFPDDAAAFCRQHGV